MDNAFVKSVRWIFAGVLTTLLFLLLSMLAVGSSVSLQVTQKENVKDTIEQAGIYENAIPIAVDTILERLEETASDSGEEVAVEDILGGITSKDEIKERLSQVFPPEWLQGEAEAAIDELYAFLSGEQDEINIEIDLSEKNNDAQAALASIFKARLNALPDCAQGVQGTIDDINLFEAECLPQNIDRDGATALIDQKVDELSLLEGQVISINPLEDGAGAGGPVRRAFFLARFAPLLAWSLVLVLVALLFALVPRDKNKMYTQGVLWGLSGTVLASAAITAKAQFDNIFLQLESRAGQDISPELAGFIKEVMFVVYSGIANKILMFAMAYILLGAGFFFLARSNKYLTYFKYARYAFAGIAILGIAGAAFIIFEAEEKGLFEPVETETIREQRVETDP